MHTSGALNGIQSVVGKFNCMRKISQLVVSECDFIISVIKCLYCKLFNMPTICDNLRWHKEKCFVIVS